MQKFSSTYWKKHVFTAELPYEKDQVVTLFLKDKFEKADVFIMSLGQMSTLPPSQFFSYAHGKLVHQKQYRQNNLKAAGPKLYFIYIPKALFAVTWDLLHALKSINFTCDIFFAQHFLPAFIAIVLKKLGILRCQKIVFWMFDFFVIPPEITRSMYYRGMDFMQGFIRKHVDEIWYTTPRLAESDADRFGPLPSSVVKRLTHGCFFRKIKTKAPAKIPPLKLAFLGSLRNNNAIYESVDAVENCVKHNMHVELLVIGSGPEEERIKKYVKQKNISKHIKFYGFEDDGHKIAAILSRCHLGMALYPADPYSPNWYITSGKFRRFISQGLPVVASTVPYFTKYIHEYNAGIIVDNDPDEVRKALQKIYYKPSLLRAMRKGANTLYNTYQTDTVFNTKFKEMLQGKARLYDKKT